MTSLRMSELDCSALTELLTFSLTDLAIRLSVSILALFEITVFTAGVIVEIRESKPGDGAWLEL